MTSGRMGLLSVSLLVLSSVSWSQVPSRSQPLYSFSKGNRYGYMDRVGRVVVPPKYNRAGDFSEGLAVVMMNRKYGCINAEGKLVIPVQYDALGSFSDGLARARVEGKFGYIDRTGKMAIPARYTRAWDFGDGRGLVDLAEPGGIPQYAYIDKTGKVVIEAAFAAAWPFSEGLACVRKAVKCSYIDVNGEVVIPTAYQVGKSFSNGLAAVKVGNRWGYIDKTGKEVITPRFQAAGPFSDRRAAVLLNRVWGYIDRTGKMVIEPRYTHVTPFSEGLAAVEVNRMWGYVDPSGREVVQTRFAKAKAFSGGVARVVIDRNWTCIDKTGTLLGQAEFRRAGMCSEGFIPVQVGTKWGYADTSGELAVQPVFDVALAFSDGLAVIGVSEGQKRDPWDRMGTVPGQRELRRATFAGVAVAGIKWGYANKKGEVVIEPQFAAAGPFCNGLARVGIPATPEEGAERKKQMGGRFHNFGAQNRGQGLLWGFVDRTGKPVVKPTYLAVMDFSEELAAVSDGKRWGYIDKTGQLVIEMKYMSAGAFKDGRAVVKPAGVPGGDLCTYIDKTGKEIYTVDVFGAHSAYPFSEGLALIVGSRNYGDVKHARFIDKDGNTVIGSPVRYLGAFHDGLACVCDRKGFFGFVDKTGKIVIKPQFYAAGDFHDGFALVETEGDDKDDRPGLRRYNSRGWRGRGFIDKTGKVVIDLRKTVTNKWWNVHGFSEGLALVQFEHGYGYINTKGELAIKQFYKFGTDFSEGRAKVRVAGAGGHDEVWKFIDKTGRVLGDAEPMPPGYSGPVERHTERTMLSEGLRGKKSDGGTWGYVDSKGRMVIEARFRDAYPFSEGLALVKMGGGFSSNQYGYVDRTGKVVIGLPFELTGSFSNGLAMIRGHDSRYGFINYSGKVVIQPTLLKTGAFSEGLAPVFVPDIQAARDRSPVGGFCPHVSGLQAVRASSSRPAEARSCALWS